MSASVALQFVSVVLVADFVSGVVHWAEDAYARKDTPIIGKWIGEANIEHHSRPRAFVARGWWASSWDLALTGVLVVSGAWWMKLLSWHVWVFALISANANQVHKWAHRAPHENGRFITWLQKFKLLQTQRSPLGQTLLVEAEGRQFLATLALPSTERFRPLELDPGTHGGVTQNFIDTV